MTAGSRPVPAAGHDRAAGRVRVVAWLLAAFTVLEAAAALVLLGLNASRMDAGRVGACAILAVASGFAVTKSSLPISMRLRIFEVSAVRKWWNW